MKQPDFMEMGHALWRNMGGDNNFSWSMWSAEAAIRKAYELGRAEQHRETLAMVLDALESAKFAIESLATNAGHCLNISSPDEKENRAYDKVCKALAEWNKLEGEQ